MKLIVAIVISFFSILGWSMDTQFVPGGKPFFESGQHVTLYTYENDLIVKTPGMKFTQKGDKAGWCNDKKVCHGQIKRPDEFRLSSKGKNIGFAVFNSRNQLTIYNHSKNASLTFNYTKNESYPSGPYSTTEVTYKGPSGKTGQFTYIHEPRMRAKCITIFEVTFFEPAGCALL